LLYCSCVIINNDIINNICNLCIQHYHNINNIHIQLQQTTSIINNLHALPYQMLIRLNTALIGILYSYRYNNNINIEIKNKIIEYFNIIKSYIYISVNDILNSIYIILTNNYNNNKIQNSTIYVLLNCVTSIIHLQTTLLEILGMYI
jgi:hypothetical protein